MSQHGPHSNLIFEVVKLTGARSYLELGIYEGETFSRICSILPDSIGVDLIDNRLIKVGNFYQCKTSDFFKNNKLKFDVIFIDACHSFEAVKEDFLNAVNALNDLGCIILHDTDPESQFYCQPGYCGDAYKMVDWVDRSKFDMVTLPLNECGLSIIRLKNKSRVITYLKNI